MGVIGIVACEILELELARILAMDADLEKVTVLEDNRTKHLIQALESHGCPNLSRIPHIRSFRPEPAKRLEVVVRLLEVALHRNRKNLRRALSTAVRELAGGRVEALLLGYGLCGNALLHIEELPDVGIPVFIPMENGRPVDDCVGLLLGGRDRYLAKQRNVAGTVFMIPGFINHLGRILHEDPKDTEHRGLKRMFNRYERSLLVVTPVMEEEEMRRNAAEFNSLLGLRCEACRGTLAILEQAWRTAKQHVRSGGPS